MQLSESELKRVQSISLRSEIKPGLIAFADGADDIAHAEIDAAQMAHDMAQAGRDAAADHAAMDRIAAQAHDAAADRDAGDRDAGDRDAGDRGGVDLRGDDVESKGNMHTDVVASTSRSLDALVAERASILSRRR